MPTYIHSIAISSENIQQLRTLLDHYRTDHPWIIKHHGVGFLGTVIWCLPHKIYQRYFVRQNLCVG